MRIPFVRSTALWGTAFVIWFTALWFLSSQESPGPDLPPIAHVDKILHFGYFFGGGGLLSAAILSRFPRLTVGSRVRLSVLILALCGVIDEHHQSYTKGRDGKSGADIAADVAGAVVGSLVFIRLAKRQKW